MRKTATLLEQSLRRAKDTTTLHYEGEIKRGSSRRTVAGREAGGTCHQVIRIIRRGDFPAPPPPRGVKKHRDPTAPSSPPRRHPAASPQRFPLLRRRRALRPTAGARARLSSPALPALRMRRAAAWGDGPPLRRRAPPRPAPCRTGSASPPASSSPAPLPRVRRCRWAPAGPRFSLQRTGLARPRGLLRPAGPRRPPPPAIPSLPRGATAALCGRSPARGALLPAPLWCAPRFALFFFFWHACARDARLQAWISAVRDESPRLRCAGGRGFAHAAPAPVPAPAWRPGAPVFHSCSSATRTCLLRSTQAAELPLGVYTWRKPNSLSLLPSL